MDEHKGSNPLYGDYRAELEKLESRGLYRALPALSGRSDKYITWEGKEYLNLGSNDYLGLAGDSALFDEFQNDFLQNLPGAGAMTSSSSRLLTGNHPEYTLIEETLAKLYRGGADKAALVFNSGYHANLGILGSLAGKHDVIFSDKLNHASIIDGMRLCNADFFRYPHCDYEALDRLLDSKRPAYKRAFIVTESLFSMDGDRADLPELVRLKKKHNALLYVDEAHSAGVYGREGRGLCCASGIVSEADIIVGTFGKALAGLGAYGICDPVIKEYLINTMRPFIFTTALAPVNVRWSRFILEKTASFQGRREHLLKLSARVHKYLADKKVKTAGDSYIIPVIVGDEELAIKKAASAREAGYLLFPIRPPTVPKGTSRVRISLTANMEWQDLEGLLDIL